MSAEDWAWVICTSMAIPFWGIVIFGDLFLYKRAPKKP